MIGRYESWLRRRAPLVAVAFPPVVQVALVIASVIAFLPARSWEAPAYTSWASVSTQAVFTIVTFWGLLRVQRAAWLTNPRRLRASAALLLIPVVGAIVAATPWELAERAWERAPVVSPSDPRCVPSPNVRVRVEPAPEWVRFVYPPTHHMPVIQRRSAEPSTFVEPEERLVCASNDRTFASALRTLRDRGLRVGTPEFAATYVWSSHALVSLLLIAIGVGLTSFGRGNRDLGREDVVPILGTVALLIVIPGAAELLARRAGLPPLQVMPWTALVVSTIGVAIAFRRRRFSPWTTVVWIAFVVLACWGVMMNPALAPVPTSTMELVAGVFSVFALALVYVWGGMRIRGMTE